MTASPSTSYRSIVSFEAPLHTLDLHDLKRFRNYVVGSRTHKAEFVANGRVPECVNLLRDGETDSKVVIASILGSLAANTQASILLALCRADTVAVLFKQLEDEARAWSTTAQGITDAVAAISLERLVLVEAYLSALKHIYKALADIVGSRTDRAARDGANTAQVVIPRTLSKSPLAGTGALSNREIRGWHLAEAGFTSPYPSLLAPPRSGHVSPERELILRARMAIELAFTREQVPLWAGLVFIERIPRQQATPGVQSGRVTATNSRVASRDTTRPGSPAVGDAASRSSSRMSAASDSLSSSLHLAASGPRRKKQDLLLQIYEGVCEIVRDILVIPSDSASDGDSPAKVVERRRSRLISLTAQKSPWWKPVAGERGRLSEDGELQAAFVRRGTSTDGRQGSPARDVASRLQIDEKSGQYESLVPDPATGVLEAIFGAVRFGRAKTQVYALDALGEMCRESIEVSRAICALHDDDAGQCSTTTIFQLRSSATASVKLAALSCLVHIHKAVQHSHATDVSILEGLLPLCISRSSVQVRAMLALGDLLADHPQLHQDAAQRKCIEDLTKVLAETKAASQVADERAGEFDFGKFMTPKNADAIDACLREASLRALAALCCVHDDIRRKFVEQTPSPMLLVVHSLSAVRVGVRAAACALVRALSRSVSILRTSLVDAGVAAKLVTILQDEREISEVKCEVLAALCNMVLKFSPVRQQLLDGEGMSCIAALATSNHAMLQLNALWAIRNALYYAVPAQKNRIVECVGWAVITDGTRSLDVDLQCEALGIIRNLTNNTDGTDVDMTIRGFGSPDDFFGVIEHVIWQRKSQECIEQAAYILVNVAASSDAYRTLILDRSNLLDALVFFLNFPRPAVRVAGIWTIHNLTQSSLGGSIPLPEAMARLLKFSFNVRLRELVEDPERDVSDRAKSLLQRLSPLAAA